MVIRPVALSDHQAVRAVNLVAFPSPAEADLVEALRADGDALVELAAVKDRRVIGHILFTRLGLEGEQDILPGAALAPMSVRPQDQRRGVGGRLIAEGVEACRRLDLAAIVVLGHPGYYPRHGFSADAARSLHDPFGAGDAFMAMALRPGALRETRRPIYAAAFGL